MQHMAGIVPILSKRRDFDFPWDDCITPVAPGFLAFERAVLECAYAGCDTIWLICNDDVSPIVRARIGDYVEDPVYLNRKGAWPSQERRQISVYYVPLDKRDYYKQNCQAWGLTYGAMAIRDISSRISKWLTTDKYYVAFPHSLYEPSIVQADRRAINSKDNYFLSFKNKTFAHGKKMGFSFGNEEVDLFRDFFKELENDVLFSKNIEIRRDYYDNQIHLDSLSDLVILKERDKVQPVPWQHPIDSWAQYCAFMAGPNCKTLAHPGKLVMSYREYQRVG